MESQKTKVKRSVGYAPKGGNTSNLFNHLKSRHPAKYSDVMQAAAARKAAPKHKSVDPQPTLEGTLEKAKLYERDGRKWQELTDAVTRCICKDILPLYSVEKEGFRNMLRKFNPQYELPSRKYFTQTAIPKLYESVRERVAAELKCVDYYSATSDLWSK